jgi:hypothetical protein
LQREIAEAEAPDVFQLLVEFVLVPLFVGYQVLEELLRYSIGVGAGMQVGYSIPSNTTVGDKTVWAENANGSSSTKKFTITRAVQAPQIGGVNFVSPFTGSGGTAGYIEVYGSDLGPNASISVTNNGQPTNDVTAIVSWAGDPSSNPPFNQINIYCTVASGAAAGAYSLAVTNSVGSTSYPIITLQ